MMMAFERVREAFWREPYGFMTNVLMVITAIGLAIAFPMWIAEMLAMF